MPWRVPIAASEQDPFSGTCTIVDLRFQVSCKYQGLAWKTHTGNLEGSEVAKILSVDASSSKHVNNVVYDGRMVSYIFDASLRAISDHFSKFRMRVLWSCTVHRIWVLARGGMYALVPSGDPGSSKFSRRRISTSSVRAVALEIPFTCITVNNSSRWAWRKPCRRT